MITYDTIKTIASNGQGNHTGQGIVYPLEYLNIIHDCTSLAELKVISCVYGYDAIIGIESENLTYSDLLERTGLRSDRSLADGLRRAIDRNIVKSVEVNGTRFYCPVAKSKAHVHDHESFKDMVFWTLNDDKDHEHADKGKVRLGLYQMLLDQFGFAQTSRTQRIAHDICLTPKYDVQRIQRQIHYTRYEVENGEDGDLSRSIRNPAGRLVDRIRSNRPQPHGFDLVAALEADGWTREELYKAVYTGQLDAPDIEGGFGYAAWLANEFGEEYDPDD